MTTNDAPAATLLTLREIAAWQVAHLPAERGAVVAALPAFQRGAVWKVKQIEDLWDSLLRRFPVGCFVIAPPDDRWKQKGFKLPVSGDGLPAHTHLLLDGQQRATGIALGFYDIWLHDVSDAPGALWLDLDAAPATSELAFVFRVVTRSQPWGYKRSNPQDTLSAGQIRAALRAFQHVNPGMETAKPIRFALTQTWPWDAEAPVPVSVLIAALDHHRSDRQAARAWAWERVKSLPLFAAATDTLTTQDAGKVEHAAGVKLNGQRARIEEAFGRRDSRLGAALDQALERLQVLVALETGYRIPALPLSIEDTDAQSWRLANEREPAPVQALDAAASDPVELLFKRVNSAGEPLAGEELTYSLLKAAWPDAAAFIDALEHKPAQPSRIAMLCVRLMLARAQSPGKESGKHALPSTPGVNEFRRLVRNQNPAHRRFQEDLAEFIERDANDLFTATWTFLTDGDYALPPALAVDLARKAPDVYLLLLRWVDRLSQAGMMERVDGRRHRRTLGFLTALAWFAKDKTRACAAVWSQLQAQEDAESLIDFFNRTRFRDSCRVDKGFNLGMVPLPSLKELELACNRGVLGHKGCSKTITRADSAIWTEWDWYEFADLLVKDRETRGKWDGALFPNGRSDDEEVDLSALTLQAVRHFFDTCYESRSLLLYAQRKWLHKWYADFDPSRPEFMEDKDRPWDFDHILPQSLLRGPNGGSLHGLPLVISDWVWSIGNFRAWPLEANRSDSNTSPAEKLDWVSPEEQRYGMNTPKAIRAASLVDEPEQWPLWQSSVPLSEDGTTVTDRRFLAKESFHPNREALVRVIVLRFIAIYREWYESLEIGKLA